MSKISSIRLSEIRETGLRDVLIAVEESCKHLEVDFYIIGALARDIWFSVEGLAVRGTKDVDLAMLVANHEQYMKLRERLINVHKFNESKNNAFVLFAPNGIQIDVLPFGAIEVQDGVAVEGKELNQIKVNGFLEVYEASVQEVRVLEDREYKVATLPGIVLLKLIAFDDRPEQRENDPPDILTIIEYYFDLQSDLIYDEHNDLFGDEKITLKMIAARVIGREMRKPLEENAKLKTRVIKILEDHIVLAEKSKFILRMASVPFIEIELCVIYLKEILVGIEEDR